MKYIRWFQDIRANDVELVGGKGANLGEMATAGFPVPPGFCVTAAAYREFIQNSYLNRSIVKILAGIERQNQGDMDTATCRIRELIKVQPVPADLVREILEGYRLLSGKLGLPTYTPIDVAVRSSATAEDLPTASFAGQQDTYLNVRGEQALLEHIKSCWASLWTARATSYRERQGFDHAKVYLAVVVQAMVPSEISGILFTANPVDGDRDVAVINASWGLGEAIVSGLVTPDTLTVNKLRGEVLSRRTASKDYTINYAEDGGVLQVETPVERREIPAINDQQALELVKLGCQIESHYGAPQDIEWAFARGRWYILQVRPITTLESLLPHPSADMEYHRSMFVEIFPDPLTPVFSSFVYIIFKSMLDFTFRTWGFKPPQDIPAVEFFYNQPYFNKDYIESAFGPLSPEVRDLLVAQVVNPFGDHKGGKQIEISLPYARMLLSTLRFMLSFPNILPGMISVYQAEVANVESVQVEERSDRELVSMIKEMVYDYTRRLIDYDFLVIAVNKRVYHFLGLMLQPYFGDSTEAIRGKLISGISGNATMETNLHLWDLAQKAKASPQVSDALRRYVGEELIRELRESSEGQDFLAELDRFLKVFGHREARLDILYPTWREDPTPVFNFLRSYLDIGDEQDPHLQQEHLAQQRQELKETVRIRLAQEPKGRYMLWPLFSWLLEMIEYPTRQRDTLHFEMTRIFPPFRRFFLELGRRWTQIGLLSQAEQVFFLTFEEIEKLALQPEPMGEIARQRQDVFEINKHRPYPDIICGKEEIYSQHVDSIQDETGCLNGVAGSPGVVTGKARVISGPEEFQQLQKGEILVAPITNPVWTPLFAVASGVITEVGGILSHGAIVAREYGIPAVMSIAKATRRIQNGQTIVVDGDRGCVYI